MLEKKYARLVIVLSIIIKSTINFIIPMHYIDKSLYFMAIAYLFINALILISVIFDNIKSMKYTICFSIIIDQVYAVLLNVISLKVMADLFYLYPSTTLLYFMGIETFLFSRALMIFTVIFTIAIYGNSIYYIYTTEKKVIDFAFMGLFAMQIMFMLFKVISKG